MSISVLEETDFNHKSLLSDKKRQSICPVCGKQFDYSRGKIYCSEACREKSKNYPEKDVVKSKYAELKSQQKTAEFFGLTRKIIQRLLK